MRRGRGVDLDDCRSSLSCLGPSTIDDDFDEGGGARYARSYSYYRLPPHLLRLSILKLDGSSFDVYVKRIAVVADLKRAIEDLFWGDEGIISWSHVWGHFCLSFEGQKLLNDRAYLRTFGIKDGDQLQFIRHLSINYSPTKSRTRHRDVLHRQHSIG